MKQLAWVAAAAITSMAVASPAAAKNVTADIEQIAGIMQDEGLRAKVETEDSGRPYIHSGLSGYTFVIHPFGCDDNWKNCKFIQFRASFAPDTKPTMAEVNKFAADNFFGRFYLDDDNDPIVEMDLDLEAGGMSKALFVDNIAYWDMILGKFGEFAFSKDKE